MRRASCCCSLILASWPGAAGIGYLEEKRQNVILCYPVRLLRRLPTLGRSDMKAVGVISGRCNIASSLVELDWRGSCAITAHVLCVCSLPGQFLLSFRQRHSFPRRWPRTAVLPFPISPASGDGMCCFSNRPLQAQVPCSGQNARPTAPSSCRTHVVDL